MTVNRADLTNLSENNAIDPGALPDSRDREVTLAMVGQGSRVLALNPSVDMAQSLAEQSCHVVALSDSRAGCGPLRRHCTAVLHGDAAKFNLGQLIRGRRFDVVLLGEALQESADPVGLLRRLIPYLTKTGSMLASVANFAHASARLALLDGSRAWQRSGLDPRRFFTLELLERTLEAAGLAATTVERVSVDPYLDPFAGVRWDRTSVPPAVRLLIDRDPEAQVARYVVRFARDTGATTAVTRERRAPTAEVDGAFALLDELEQRALAQPEIEAHEARSAAEARAADLEAELEQARERDAQLHDELEALEALRNEHDELQRALDERDQRLADSQRLAEQRAGAIAERDETLAAGEQRRDELEQQLASQAAKLADEELKLQQRDRALRAKAEAERLLRGRLAEQAEQADHAEAALRRELAELERDAQQTEQSLREQLADAHERVDQRRHELEQAEHQATERERELRAELAEIEDGRFELVSELTVHWARRDDQQRALEAEIDLRTLIEQRLQEVERARARAERQLARGNANERRLTSALGELWQQLGDLDEARQLNQTRHAEELETLRDELTGQTNQAEARAAAAIDGLQLQLDIETARADHGFACADALRQELVLADRLLSQGTTERLDLFDRLDEVERERNLARQAAEASEHVLAEAEMALEEAQTELNAEIELRLSEADKAFEVFQAQLDVEVERADVAEQAAEDGERATDALQQQLGASQRRHQLLSRDLTQLEAENSTLAAELDDALAVADQARAEASADERRWLAAEQQLALREQALATFQRQLDQEHARTRWAEGRLEALERALEQGHEAIEQRDTALEALGDRLQRALGQASADLERSTVVMNEQLHALEAEIGESRREAERTASESDELRDQLSKVEQHAQQLQRQHAARASRLEGELAQVRESVAYRILDHCDRARERLLPSGSRRRAAYNWLLALSGASPRAQIEVETVHGAAHHEAKAPAPTGLVRVGR